MGKKVDIKKLEEAGFLSGTYHRYRSLAAEVKRQRRNGKTKLQAIHDTGAKKGASERTVYDALKAVAKMR